MLSHSVETYISASNSIHSFIVMFLSSHRLRLRTKNKDLTVKYIGNMKLESWDAPFWKIVDELEDKPSLYIETHGAFHGFQQVGFFIPLH